MILALVLVACSNDPPAPVAAVTATEPKEEEPATAAPAPPLPCPHPYFPLVEGARWEHTLRSGRTKTKVTTTVGRIAKTETVWRAPVEVTSAARVLRGTAECASDGAHVDLGALHAVGDVRDLSVAFDLRAAGHEGFLLPREMGADATWTASLATLVSAGDSMTKRATVRSELRFRRMADESVTTPAGTFDAVHLHAESTGIEEAVLMGRSMPSRTLDAWTVDLWLAQGVGEVKSATAQGDVSLEWTLVEYEIPSP